MRRLSLLLAALAPLPMAAQAPYGPLSSQESGPLQRVGFTHVVDRADLVETGAIQFESWVGYSNIFENDSSATHHLNMDLERLSTDIGVRWGAKRRLEAGARFAFETTGGGVLDGFITDWHKLFGLPDADRGKYPFGAYAQMLTDATGKVRLDLPKRTMALEDVRLSAKWRAWQSADGRKLLSLSGIARLPIEDDHVGPRRVDVAASALARSSWTRWHLHGTVGAATVREAQDYDGLLRGGSFFADVAPERRRADLARVAAPPGLRRARDRRMAGQPRARHERPARGALVDGRGLLGGHPSRVARRRFHPGNRYPPDLVGAPGRSWLRGDLRFIFGSCLPPLPT